MGMRGNSKGSQGSRQLWADLADSSSDKSDVEKGGESTDSLIGHFQRKLPTLSSNVGVETSAVSDQQPVAANVEAATSIQNHGMANAGMIMQSTVPQHPPPPGWCWVRVPINLSLAPTSSCDSHLVAQCLHPPGFSTACV